MDTQWISPDNALSQVEVFAQELTISPALTRVLINRGIDNFDRAKAFFRPHIDQLHDPFLMTDMRKAVDRIMEAKSRNEQVTVYGDYDVDGTTSVSMLMLFFREIGIPARYYIPNRLKEGYGLSEAGMREVREWGTNLVLTTDCGITAVDQVALANTLGMDVIITDHHETGDRLPPALAILNPKRKDCRYPFQELAGIGVAFKLIQALAGELRLDPRSYLDHLDLVSIGSAADIVPLVGENRILVHAGMRRLNESPKTGVRSLLKAAGMLEHEVGTGQIAFNIGPRINAVGRMGEARRAVELLTSDSETQADQISGILEEENRKRRAVDEEILRDAIRSFEAGFELDNTLFIVLADDNWHPGVIGIVASRLVERYYRPTVLIATENGIGKGSVRSVPGFDVYQALKACSDLFIDFGGHKYAAGLTIATRNIPQLLQRLDLYSREHMTEDTLTPKIKIDSELHFREITAKFIRVLKLFAPFGLQNHRPVFMSRNLQTVGAVRIVGNNHLKFKVRQDGIVMDAIGFNLGDYQELLVPGGDEVAMVFVIEENYFMGQTTLQLRVKDIRTAPV